MSKVESKQSRIQRFHEATEQVADLYAKIPSVTSVVIGGSLARNYTDKVSDIEMYVYYDQYMPTKKEIMEVIEQLGASFTRSKNVHWFHEAWGHHTFFKYKGIKFELGYRDIHEMNVRIRNFKQEFLLPKHGLHDTPFGHYESGIASCITECKALYDRGDEIANLKKYLSDYSTSWIKDETFRYYIADAETILKVKAAPAAVRNDIYNFNACIARAVRGLTIAVFALNDTYYPGDKWNAQYIATFSKLPKDYELSMNTILHMNTVDPKDKRLVVNKLLKITNEVKTLYSQGVL